MKGKSKRKFTPTLNRTGSPVKVALEVLKKKDTLVAIGKRHELHGTGHPAESDCGTDKGCSMGDHQ